MDLLCAIHCARISSACKGSDMPVRRIRNNGHRVSSLVTATAPSGSAFSPARTFACLVYVNDVGIRYWIAVELHNGICKVGALVGFHPRFDIRAASKQQQQHRQ